MTDSGEEAFGRLIGRLEPAHGAFLATLKRGLGATPQWGVDDQPGRVLLELTAAAAVHYLAGLYLVQRADQAFASEVFVRSQLEYMVNVAFVAGRDDPAPRGTAEQRAGCLRVARAREVARLLSRSPAAGTEEKTLAQASVDAAVRAHDQGGCAHPGATNRWPCRAGTTHSMVKFMLGRLQRPVIPEADRVPAFVVQIFEAASLSLHLLGLGRFLLPDPATGAIVFTPAKFVLRAHLVEALLYGLDRGMTWTLDLLVPGTSDPFREWMADVRSDRTYKAAKAGELDG